MIIYVSGVFDILHRGHIDLFKYAKQLDNKDNYLIVGVSKDEDVEKYKRKPVEPLSERMYKVENLKWVDKVIVAEDNRKITNLDDYDYVVTSDEYEFKDEEIYREPKKQNKIKYFRRNENYSSTKIIEKIKG